MEIIIIYLIGNGSCHTDRTHNSLYGIFIRINGKILGVVC